MATINKREATSIKAMLAYVAHNQNVREETIKALIEAQFGVSDFEKIERDDYQRAIEYLTDLQVSLH